MVPLLHLSCSKDDEDSVGEDTHAGDQDEETRPDQVWIIREHRRHHRQSVRNNCPGDVAEHTNNTHDGANKVRTDVLRITPGSDKIESWMESVRLLKSFQLMLK